MSKPRILGIAREQFGHGTVRTGADVVERFEGGMGQLVLGMVEHGHQVGNPVRSVRPKITHGLQRVVGGAGMVFKAEPGETGQDLGTDGRNGRRRPASHTVVAVVEEWEEDLLRVEGGLIRAL